MLARWLSPLAWRGPARTAQKLFEFAHAEQGSMLDMQLAAAATADPARAALYLRHAADEGRHAQIFTRRADELQKERGVPGLGTVRADTVGLFETLGELDFLAFVHRGEARACAQFEAYHAWFEAMGRERDRAVFAGVLVDEERHRDYTAELLLQLGGSPHAVRRALRRATWREAWLRMRRAGRGLTSPLYSIAMITLYALLLPLALPLRLGKTASGWLRPE